MSDLPEIKNEPTVDMPRGDLAEFARGFRSAPGRPARQNDESHKPRFKYLPALLAILVAIVGGWHWFATHHLEEQLTRHLANYVRENLPDVSATVDVHPLTNLVEIQITRNVARKEAAFEFLGDAIIEYVRQELEPKMDRELSARARRDVDLYAMMVPYQASITIDKVRAPPLPPPSRIVQEIQHKLSAQGYDAGPADGQLGVRTRNAIEAFQRDHGLTVDGRATGEFLELLGKE